MLSAVICHHTSTAITITNIQAREGAAVTAVTPPRDSTRYRGAVQQAPASSGAVDDQPLRNYTVQRTRRRCSGSGEDGNAIFRTGVEPISRARKAIECTHEEHRKQTPRPLTAQHTGIGAATGRSLRHELTYTPRYLEHFQGDGR